MPEPYYGNNATDYELELLRRQGLIKPTGPRQGGLMQMLGGLLSDPGAAASGAVEAVKSDPVGVARGLIVDPVVEMGRGWNDRVTGRVPVMDPTTGRTTPESIGLMTDIAGSVTGGGTAAQLGRRAPNTVSMSGGMPKPVRRAADEAGAAPLPAPKSVSRTSKKRSTIKDPERVAYPGIYDRPDEIARLAAERVAPEDPALKEVFGVTRDELYEMGKGRTGNVDAKLPKNATSGKNANAERVMTKKNTQRMLDTLSEAEKYPGLQRGMDSWYVMDPLYQEYVRLYGPERAYDEFMRFNTFTGMSSPGSDVLTEINRGSAANYLERSGRFDDFVRYGGKAEPSNPPDMAAIKGHPYHSTSHAGPMSRYIESGDISDMQTTKVPLYIQSNTNPVRYQSNRPVGDAHYVRGIGLSDARTAADYGASIKNTELATIAPWWKEKIADELGITPVQAQGRSWGTFGHATGVDTPIGAPKLELIAIRIKEAARKYNLSIPEARDLVLKGGGYASIAGGSIALPGLLDDPASEEPVY